MEFLPSCCGLLLHGHKVSLEQEALEQREVGVVLVGEHARTPGIITRHAVLGRHHGERGNFMRSRLQPLDLRVQLALERPVIHVDRRVLELSPHLLSEVLRFAGRHRICFCD